MFLGAGTNSHESIRGIIESRTTRSGFQRRIEAAERTWVEAIESAYHIVFEMKLESYFLTRMMITWGT